MPQSIGGTVTALVTACQTTFAATTSTDGVAALVLRGMPGQYQPNIIVAVGTTVRQPITRPTMGTGRSREITAEIDVIISVYVPGGEEAQQTADDTALTMQGLLETYLRTGSNSTLGGACRDAWVSFADLAASIAYQQFDDPNIPAAPTGRIAENTLTVTAAIRY